MDKLIAIAVALAILTVSTGQLPKVLYQVHMAQLHLIKETQASNWGKLPLLSIKK